MPGYKIVVPTAFTDLTLPKLPAVEKPDPAGGPIVQQSAGLLTVASGQTDPNGNPAARLTRASANVGQYAYANSAPLAAGKSYPVGTPVTFVVYMRIISGTGIDRVQFQVCNPFDGSSPASTQFGIAGFSASGLNTWVKKTISGTLNGSVPWSAVNGQSIRYEAVDVNNGRTVAPYQVDVSIVALLTV